MMKLLAPSLMGLALLSLGLLPTTGAQAQPAPPEVGLPFKDGDQSWTEDEKRRVLSALAVLPRIFSENGALKGFKRVKDRYSPAALPWEGRWSWFWKPDGVLYVSDTAFTCIPEPVRSLFSVDCDLFTLEYIVTHELTHAVEASHPGLLDEFARTVGYQRDGNRAICQLSMCEPPTGWASHHVGEDLAESVALYIYAPNRLNRARYRYLERTLFGPYLSLELSADTGSAGTSVGVKARSSSSIYNTIRFSVDCGKVEPQEVGGSEATVSWATTGCAAGTHRIVAEARTRDDGDWSRPVSVVTSLAITPNAGAR
jgi:hypothetical protein